jgi:sarcosine oxidase subunit gamma
MSRASDRSGGHVRLRELPHHGQLAIQAEVAVPPALERVVGVELPTRPNDWHPGPPQAYWLGPGEWLIVGEPQMPEKMEDDLRAAAEDSWAAIIDVSDQRTILELDGPAAAEVLAGGCSIDLHRRAFGAGRCAQTLVGRAGVLIARGDRPDGFRLFVRSSFADYLAEWLLDAMANLDLNTPGEIDGRAHIPR